MELDHARTEVVKHDFVVVANRLPVERDDDVADDAGWRPSPGGLARALLGVLRQRDGVWLGWTGANADPARTIDADGVALQSIELSADEVRQYYEQVSNGALWPLYHDAIRSSTFDNESWGVYREVNQRFADAADEVAAFGATVWVHDYQLQLVPAMLRAKRPDLRIGFFLHIPFPPQELFMRLPWRDEILHGLLGADVIGFQRRVAAENFVGLCSRLVDAELREPDLLEPDLAEMGHGPAGTEMIVDGRRVLVAAFPISIDAAEIDALARAPKAAEHAAELRRRLGDPAVILLGVDRLDYTKGIEERLGAVRTLLARRAAAGDVEAGPDAHPQLVFVQVAVPSRESVDEYAQERHRVEQLVGELNGAYATLGNPVVHYLYRSLPLAELVTLYRAADVMLVTPLRDGMNLVAKEFVAARSDGGGVLVLSEFAGAVDELDQAIIVNPHDPEGFVDAIESAIALGGAEARQRMHRLRDVVAVNDVEHWSTTFLDALASVHV